jgi:hypothetical protein
MVGTVCVFPNSLQNCVCSWEIRKEAAKIKHYVPQEGKKERKYAKQNISHLTDNFLITLRSSLPF